MRGRNRRYSTLVSVNKDGHTLSFIIPYVQSPKSYYMLDESKKETSKNMQRTKKKCVPLGSAYVRMCVTRPFLVHDLHPRKSHLLTRRIVCQKETKKQKEHCCRFNSHQGVWYADISSMDRHLVKKDYPEW